VEDTGNTELGEEFNGKRKEEGEEKGQEEREGVALQIGTEMDPRS
jgi:hypothetical protein